MKQLLGIIAILLGVHLLTEESSKEQFGGSKKSQSGGSKPEFVAFHMPWCGYCVKLMPTWKKLKHPNVEIKDKNCEENGELCKQHGIESYPTIKYFPNGMKDKSNYISYTGERSLNAFKKFLDAQI